MPYFPDIPKIVYEGPRSKNPLAFKHYNPDELVEGKPMRDHLRFAAAYWHVMRNPLADPFGGTLSLTFINDFSTTGSVKIFAFENYGSNFTSLSTTGLADGYSATFDSLNGTVNVVPEPSTYALLTLGALGLGAHLLRRRRTP